jgi:Flp pilus assembly pilin Flp
MARRKRPLTALEWAAIAVFAATLIVAAIIAIGGSLSN